jgi:osmotically-inducible protein OsmY
VRPDNEIRQEVQEGLDWDAEIGARDIAIAVRNGVVTLAGYVRSYGERMQAEAGVKRVAGVVGLANDIEVRLPLLGRRPDPEIAREVAAGIQTEIPTVGEQIRVRVADGRVTLEGEVDWHYQRARAEELARQARGIRTISNDIVVKPQSASMEIKRKIEAAFRRRAELDAEAIMVETAAGGAIILTGAVRSWAERDEAERMAWSAPGVTNVENRIEVVG